MTDFTYTAIDRWSHLAHLERDFLSLGHTSPTGVRQSSLNALWHQWQASFGCVEALEAFAADMARAIPEARGLLTAMAAANLQQQLHHVSALAQALLADPTIAALRAATSDEGHPGASAQQLDGAADSSARNLAAFQYLFPLARDLVIANRQQGMAYVFRQVVQHGAVWESTPRHARNITEVVRGVAAGFLHGSARWAVQLSDANGASEVFLGGLDAQGRPLKALDALQAGKVTTGPAQVHEEQPHETRSRQRTPAA